MEAPVRVFNPYFLNRCLSSKTLPPSRLLLYPDLNHIAVSQQSCTPFHFSSSLRKGVLSRISPSFSPPRCSLSPIGSSYFSGPNPFNFFFSLPSWQYFDSHIQPSNLNSLPSHSNVNARPWNRDSESAVSGNLGHFVGEDRATAVVLLGWLGAKSKHLRRYVEWYNSRGIRALTFMVDPKEVILSVSGRNVEKRITALAEELISWLSDGTDNAKERGLIFHTFSNTGWFVYGAILEILQGRKELLEKIKGCIVDSGGGDPLGPQVWAAGFTAAMLKKQSSSAYAMVNGEKIEETEKDMTLPKIGEKEPLVLETLLLSVLEKFFSAVLKLPYVDKRLKKIISILTENQLLYPELYLYSSADKVMPFKSVEQLIEKRKKMGKTVMSYNFHSSPHVDHYRAYPDIYSSQLHKFLVESLSMNPANADD